MERCFCNVALPNPESSWSVCTLRMIVAFLLTVSMYLHTYIHRKYSAGMHLHSDAIPRNTVRSQDSFSETGA